MSWVRSDSDQKEKLGMIDCFFDIMHLKKLLN